ncbi:MAG: hypothetical protein KDB27_34555 [Planctomycetales bacterium]|nr:hypothetical protein [Planctomycetales bacterium]
MNDSATEPNPQTSPQSYRPERLWVVVVLCVAFSVFFYGRNWPKSLMANRHMILAEQALDRHLTTGSEEDWQTAVTELDKAVARHPTHDIYSKKALLLGEKCSTDRTNGKLASAKEFGEAALDAINTAISEKRVAVYYQTRAEINLRLNRFKDAAADTTLFIQTMPDSYGDFRDLQLASALNSRAYSRALGEFELDLALKDIETALNIMPNEPSLLDTHAYLLYLTGAPEKALPILDDCISRLESQFKDQESRVYIESRAVMLHHRGLVYKAMGKELAAQADLEEAEKLGFSPERGVH